MQTLPRSPTRREFSKHIRLNTVDRGYQAKVYKFNNRKDDAVFSNDNRRKLLNVPRPDGFVIRPEQAVNLPQPHTPEAPSVGPRSQPSSFLLFLLPLLNHESILNDVFSRHSRFISP
jgi:hypothetical protein